MKISKSLFLVIPFVFWGIACKKKEVVNNPTIFDVNQINIQDSAKLMFVLTSEDPLLGNAAGNSLYMITTKDKIKQVPLTQTNGSDVSNVLRPGQLANATQKYMLANFSRSGGNPNEAYLIDKKTGVLTQIGDRSSTPTYINYYQRNNILCKSDGSNLFYKITPQIDPLEIIKLNVGTLVKTHLELDSLNSVTGLDIDAQGNVLAAVWFQGSKPNVVYASNGIVSQKLADKYKNATFWVANDGVFRVYRSDTLHKLSYDNTQSKFIMTPELLLSDNGLNVSFDSRYLYRLAYNNKTVVVTQKEVYEFDHSAKKVKKVTSINSTNIKWVDHSSTLGHLYLAAETSAGQETIFDVDLSSYSHKTLTTTGKYLFYEIEAFEDGNIYATAKRLSDSKFVILKFKSDGTEVLLDDKQTQRGVWLEKVTEFTND